MLTIPRPPAHWMPTPPDPERIPAEKFARRFRDAMTHPGAALYGVFVGPVDGCSLELANALARNSGWEPIPSAPWSWRPAPAHTDLDAARARVESEAVTERLRAFRDELAGRNAKGP